MPTARKSAEQESKKKFSMEDAKAIAAALGIDWENSAFDLNQFCCGLNVELEHGTRSSSTNVTNDDPKLTGQIALAHLLEFPDYYDRLAKMESAGKSTEKSASATNARPNFIKISGRTYRRTDLPRFVKVNGHVYEFVATVQGRELETQEMLGDIKMRIDRIKNELPNLDAAYAKLDAFVGGKGESGVSNKEALRKLVDETESTKSKVVNLILKLNQFDDSPSVPESPEKVEPELEVGDKEKKVE